jgi:glucose 1-dehydrogenase
MRALTVLPGVPDSGRVEHVPEPPAADGSILVRTLALGLCGTDREIIAAKYGAPPPGHDRLILGHESLGEVLEAPSGVGVVPGDLVVGIVRRPDPVPCSACAIGEWDMCRNGRYTERGIKERNGFGAERFRLEPEFTIKIARALGFLGVLLEPASIVAKGWDHIERIGQRARSWQPRTVLVTGAGPIGLLAALIGTQRGYEVHVLDHAKDGPKPALVRALGAIYHQGDRDGFMPDIVLECTGVPSIILDVIERHARNSIVCLAGLSPAGHKVELDLAAINRNMVLDNDVVFGTVNANRSHYEMAAMVLANADQTWLNQMISRRVPLDCWPEALQKRPGDIKVVLDFT